MSDQTRVLSTSGIVEVEADIPLQEAAVEPYVAPSLGKYARGEHHPRTRLLTEQVREIRRRSAQGEFTKTLAREFEVSPATVRRITQGTTWRHLITPTTAPALEASQGDQGNA